MSIENTFQSIGNWFSAIPGHVVEQTGFKDPEWISNFKAKDDIAKVAVDAHESVVITVAWCSISGGP